MKRHGGLAHRLRLLGLVSYAEGSASEYLVEPERWPFWARATFMVASIATLWAAIFGFPVLIMRL